MASYHLCMKVGGRGKGLSHASYIFREGRYSNSHVEEELEYKTSGNLPEWAKDGKDFWRAADENERACGRAYREIVVALPNELTKEQRVELTKEFIEKHIGKDFVYSVAIHSKAATLGEGHKNPHAHIMLCERKLDGIDRGREQFFKQANTKRPEIGGNKKDREWTTKEKLKNIRESWANYQNRMLARYGHEARVDHRSFETRKAEAIEKKDIATTLILSRNPEKHVGPKVAAQVKKQLNNNKGLKTQAEIALLREKFLSSHPNDKVRNNHVKRKIHAVSVEIYDEKRLANIYEDAQQLTGKELVEHLNEYIDQINNQKTSLLQDKKDLENDVLSKERAHLMAISIHTRGKTKELSNIARKLEKERRNYIKRRGVFEKMRKPGLLEVKYKAEYQDKHNQLQAWNKDLTMREASNKDEINKLKETLKQPQNMLKIDKITEGILEKNKQKVAQLEDVKIRIAKLDDAYDKLINLKYDAVNNLSKTLHLKGGISKNNILNQAQQITKQLKQAIYSLPKERGGMGGMSARIHDDEDHKHKKEHDNGR